MSQQHDNNYKSAIQAMPYTERNWIFLTCDNQIWFYLRVCNTCQNHLAKNLFKATLDQYGIVTGYPLSFDPIVPNRIP